MRCDLLQEVARPHVLVARKVFRSAEARREHEASPHFAQWRKRVADALGDAAAAPPPRVQLDTVYPRSSPFPFRSGWTTV